MRLPLWSERVFCVLPEGHKIAEKKNIIWQDLGRETFMVSEVAPGPEIHDFLVQRLARLGHHPNIEIQAVEAVEQGEHAVGAVDEAAHHLMRIDAGLFAALV